MLKLSYKVCATCFKSCAILWTTQYIEGLRVILVEMSWIIWYSLRRAQINLKGWAQTNLELQLFHSTPSFFSKIMILLFSLYLAITWLLLYSSHVSQYSRILYSGDLIFHFPPNLTMSYNSRTKYVTKIIWKYRKESFRYTSFLSLKMREFNEIYLYSTRRSKYMTPLFNDDTLNYSTRCSYFTDFTPTPLH